MNATIRTVQADDAAQIAAIYAPYCTASIVSFEMEAPSPAMFGERIAKVTARYPWLVLDQDGIVGGYVYAGQHSERAAYQWATDVTAYIAPDFQRRGVGRALYTALFDMLVLQGFFKSYAGISLPNAASVGLHTAMGFTPVGVYHNVGYKFGAWHDVGWYEYALQPERLEPAPPRGVSAVLGTPEWDAALAAGIALL